MKGKGDNNQNENQKPKVEIRLNDNIKDLIRGWAKLDYVGFFDTPERLYDNWFFILRDYIKVATWIEHKDFPEDVLKKIPDTGLPNLMKFYLGRIPELHPMDYYINPDVYKKIQADCKPYVEEAWEQLSIYNNSKTQLGKTNQVAFLANIFDAKFWNLQQTFTYKKPYGKLRSNNIADLSTEIVKIDGFQMTATRLKEYIDTIRLFAKQVRPTQTMRFKNASIIDGRLISNTEQLALAYDDTDFVVVSDLEIPTIIPEKVKQFVRNYTHYNPKVHSDKQDNRPFLEMELAWLFYSAMSKYTVGKNRTNIGMAFLYEYQKTGGSRGKSTILEALQNIINSSYDTMNTLDTPAGAMEASRINDRQNRIDIATQMLTVLAEKDEEKYTLEFEAFLKSKNDAGLKDTAKYATQFSSTTQLGSIATTSNFQPRFTSSGDFLRDRFYGIVFTQQFAKRGDLSVNELLQDEEFLGGLVRWAFDRIDSQETFDMLVEHFKQQYDITMSVGNMELETAYQFFNTHNDKRYSAQWEFMTKRGRGNEVDRKRRVITRENAREIFSLLAGATRKTITGIQYISDEPQYKNVARFTKYLETIISNDKRLRDIIDFQSRVNINGDTSQKIVINDVDRLAELTDLDERKTEIEKAWLKQHEPKAEAKTVEKVVENEIDTSSDTPVGLQGKASQSFEQGWIASLKEQYQSLTTDEAKNVFLERTAQAIMAMSKMTDTEPDYLVHTREVIENKELPENVFNEIFNGSVFDTDVGILQVITEAEHIYRLRLIT